MNRTYELMFIVRPDMPEEEQDKLIATLESAMTSSGGALKKVERMGKRRLAYTVRRFFEGVYLLADRGRQRRPGARTGAPSAGH